MEASVSATTETTKKPLSRQPWFWVALAAGAFVFFVLALGIVATLIVPNVLQKFAFASRKKAEADILAIDSAVKEFAIANGGKFPDSLQLLVTQDVNGQTFLDMNHIPKDPWGRVYVYEPPGPGSPQPRILSYGRDGQPGGEGDDADLDNLTLRRGD